MITNVDVLSDKTLELLRTSKGTLVRHGATISFIRDNTLITGVITTVESKTKFGDYYICGDEDLITVTVERHKYKLFSKTFYIQPPSIHRIANNILLESPTRYEDYELYLGGYKRRSNNAETLMVLKEYNPKLGLYISGHYISDADKTHIIRVDRNIISVPHWEDMMTLYRYTTPNDLDDNDKKMLLEFFI